MPERFDLVIRHGTVVDGTRAPRYVADVAVSGDRIAGIGALAGASGAVEIDARQGRRARIHRRPYAR
jgi:N-acyl-D-amino-acid deacylase